MYCTSLSCVNIFLWQSPCDFCPPSLTIMSTRALSDGTSLPRAAFSLIPPFCFILYLNTSFHASAALFSATSHAPQWLPITLGSSLHFPSLQRVHWYVCLQNIAGAMTFSWVVTKVLAYSLSHISHHPTVHNVQLCPALSICSEIHFLFQTPPPQFTAYPHPYPSLSCTSLMLAEPQPPPLIHFFILYYSILFDPSDFIKPS